MRVEKLPTQALLASAKAVKPTDPLRPPLYSNRVAAGFPSPAEDHVDRPLDLNEYLIAKPSASYFARASGESMQGLGIYDGDLLIVDRSLKPKHNDIVIAALSGELTCKRLDMRCRQLKAAHPDYPPISLPDHCELIIEGVVIHAVHHFHPVVT